MLDLLQPPNLIPLHSLLDPNPLGNNRLARSRDAPALQPLLANPAQGLLLHEAIAPVLPVEAVRLAQVDGRVRDDAHAPQRVARRAVHHERVHQEDVADFARRLDE